MKITTGVIFFITFFCDNIKHTNGIIKQSHKEDIFMQKCGTRSASPKEKRLLKSVVDNFKEKRKEEKNYERALTFKVHFHVILGTGGFLGDVTEEQVRKQIDVLNEAFNGTLTTYGEESCSGDAVETTNTSIQFELKRITRTVNQRWFACGAKGNIEEEFKTLLRRGDCTDLNIYTINSLSEGYYGWSALPNICEDWPIYDGVVIDYTTVPDGSCCKEFQTQGDTLVHEVGHWLGLQHTFEGGCEGDGDGIDDTPSQGDPTFGCPDNKNTCEGEGDDPFHNYMDFSDDCCVHEFTPGQITRMHAMIDRYRSDNNLVEGDNTTQSIFKEKGGSCVMRVCENDIEWSIKCNWIMFCSGCASCKNLGS